LGRSEAATGGEGLELVAQEGHPLPPWPAQELEQAPSAPPRDPLVGVDPPSNLIPRMPEYGGAWVTVSSSIEGGIRVETWGWWTLAGLVADIVGAAVLATGLFISKERAIELGVSRVAGDTDDENLRLPAVKDRLNQSGRAVIGLSVLALGFALQAIGALLSAAGSR
jgi:hypothetical protein